MTFTSLIALDFNFVLKLSRILRSLKKLVCQRANCNQTSHNLLNPVSFAKELNAAEISKVKELNYV